MPRLRERYGLDLHKVPFDFPELIAALAPRAFFTSSPLHDANFEVEGVHVCLNAARPVYSLLGKPDRLMAVHPDGGSFVPGIRKGSGLRISRSGTNGKALRKSTLRVPARCREADVCTSREPNELDSPRESRTLQHLSKWNSREDEVRQFELAAGLFRSRTSETCPPTYLNLDEGAMDRRILVVDDSELICQQLSQLLALPGPPDQRCARRHAGAGVAGGATLLAGPDRLASAGHQRPGPDPRDPQARPAGDGHRHDRHTRRSRTPSRR